MSRTNRETGSPRRVGLGAAVAAGLMLAALAAPVSCGGPGYGVDPETQRPPRRCGADLDVTAPCGQDIANQHCLWVDDPSTCAVSDCQCQDGSWQCAPLRATEGDVCGDLGDLPVEACPEVSDGLDGGVDDTRSCSCGDDGLWSCSAAAPAPDASVPVWPG